MSHVGSNTFDKLRCRVCWARGSNTFDKLGCRVCWARGSNTFDKLRFRMSHMYDNPT
ncbi:hypothetical protein [Neodiprion abietis nucleopolyhedrovirus]|uniref:Uncharacterized protein n=1 Tax=Neodiprion abietis nucleopolyhedrovirus TaxID=204507 RepID=Q0ZNZ9_9CBAC|nr:hypothetical protein [Neodiprion abietis nucleopolyhedrovirus]ABC74955.1 unknown [Neodiprion abietis nucleopolyhedrovirus]